jgi:hypothetical protein
MKTLRLVTMLAVLAGAAAAQAQSVEMAAMAPLDAKALIEVNDAAGLRQTLLESKFWAALEGTQAFKDWRGSEKYAQMRERVDALLKNLEMDEGTALQTYLGGRMAVVLLASADEKKPDGVLLLEVAGKTPADSQADAQRFIEAVGAVEAGKHGDAAIWEVRRPERTDRIALAGGVLVMSNATSDALERVLDTKADGQPSLGTSENFRRATDGLLDGWRIRAYAAEVTPRKAPGAVAMAPQGKGRLHFEWRMLGGEPDLLEINEPTVLTSPSALPATTVAAVAAAFHPAAIWEKVKAKLAADAAAGAEKLQRAEMFVRGFFPGKTMTDITGAFGPEAALALQRGEAGGAPGVVGLVKLTGTGKAVAQAFKDGLAAKAMILAALRDPEKQPAGPRLNVREETVDATPVLIVEAPGFLDKFLGDWAKDVALTVAVTDNWLVVGTSVSGVKASVRTATGAETQATLAASLKAQGEDVPSGPVTHWGTVRPAAGSDIVLGLAEKLAGKDRVEQAKKLTNLAELLELIDRFTWERTDKPDIVTGKADLQAVD